MEANTDKLRDGAWKLLGISLGIEEISRRDTNTLAMKLGELRRMRRVESLYSGQQQIGDGLRQMVEKVRGSIIRELLGPLGLLTLGMCWEFF